MQFLFRKVRDRVLEATQCLQEPFAYGSLPGVAIYLRPPLPVAAAVMAHEAGCDALAQVVCE